MNLICPLKNKKKSFNLQSQSSQRPIFQYLLSKVTLVKAKPRFKGARNKPGFDPNWLQPNPNGIFTNIKPVGGEQIFLRIRIPYKRSTVLYMIASA